MEILTDKLINTLNPNVSNILESFYHTNDNVRNLIQNTDISVLNIEIQVTDYDASIVKKIYDEFLQSVFNKYITIKIHKDIGMDDEDAFMEITEENTAELITLFFNTDIHLENIVLTFLTASQEQMLLQIVDIYKISDDFKKAKSKIKAQILNHINNKIARIALKNLLIKHTHRRIDNLNIKTKPLLFAELADNSYIHSDRILIETMVHIKINEPGLPKINYSNKMSLPTLQSLTSNPVALRNSELITKMLNPNATSHHSDELEIDVDPSVKTYIEHFGIAYPMDTNSKHMFQLIGDAHYLLHEIRFQLFQNLLRALFQNHEHLQEKFNNPMYLKIEI